MVKQVKTKTTLKVCGNQISFMIHSNLSSSRVI